MKNKVLQKLLKLIIIVAFEILVNYKLILIKDFKEIKKNFKMKNKNIKISMM